MPSQAQVDALRRTLGRAASDLANLAGADALGDELYRLSDGVDGAGLEGWRRSLREWKGLSKVQRATEVARGLRLLRAQTGVAKPPPPTAGTPRTGLDAPTDSLPGIGPALAARLAEHGIETVEDLVWLLPRRYDDVRRVRPLGDIGEGELGERITVRAAVRSARFMRRGRRRWVDVRLEDGDVSLAVRFFGAHDSLAKKFPAGSSAALSGKLTSRGSQLEMSNPDVLEVTGESARWGEDLAIIPRFRDLQGVPAKTLRKAITAAASRSAGLIVSSVPEALSEGLGLSSLPTALASLHAPPPGLAVEEVEAMNRQDSTWHRRLAFEELFVLGAVIAERRRRERADVAMPCLAAPDLQDEVEAVLPFEPTGAQRRVMAEIAADLGSTVPMNRLLQGDVGSGKTAVAFAAIAQVVASGRQAAFMAPTEILAEQHLRSLGPWCEARGMRVAMLTASMPSALQQTTLSLLAAGEIDAVVGTHALLSERVVFADLALVAIDEQHRFGVAQRVRLRAKGEGGAPHLLVMTATPIPRTLALSAYGDLDVSTLDELPPGRQPPRTRVLHGRAGRAEAYAALRERLRAGARGYLVCPMVEPSEDSVASGWADTLTASTAIDDKWPEARVAVVHGQLCADERDQAMQRFRTGEANLLVATTVIEVGVDVPEATVMLIEDADRFGLSQLHQLRGRVGRGGGEALCLLVTRGAKSSDGARRLAVLGETGDGFAIAEADLEIRGPGELLGTRQAGLPRLRFGDLSRHTELLRTARAEAEALLERDPALALPDHATLRRTLERLASAEVYGAEGG